MSRQSVSWKRWIVVNDGTEAYRYNLGQDVILRDNSADPPGLHSLQLNLAAAIPLVDGSKIAIVEDDDWYSPWYLQCLLEMLQERDLVGFAPCAYYHVAARKWRYWDNADWASLAATGFSSVLLPLVQEACYQFDNLFVDRYLWTHWDGAKGLKGNKNKPAQVGLKGLGELWGVEPGAGLAHDPNRAGRPDPKGKLLRQWIGEDCENYLC